MAMTSTPRTDRPFAVLFDFDGTLVDTEPIWMSSEIEILGRYGVPWTLDDARRLCGTSREYSVDTLMGQMARHGADMTGLDPDSFYAELSGMVARRIASEDLPFLPGAVELLHALAQEDVPCALVSASPEPMLRQALSRFPHHPLRVLISGSSVSVGKPAPDGYLLAARQLGVDPADCVVVEDTLSGTQAGLAAGAVVVAVPGQRPIPDAPGMVRVDSLEGMTPDALRRLRDEVQAREKEEAALR
ncbi:MAG: HAD family phosphatase [Propionibacteriaceae bacterium]|nr:HAD family phosphatase [Propionibacteriaceae bacterium]